MTDLLAIGASGLRAYRASLAATGDNIANAQTVGYARRSVRLQEVSITGAPDFRYRNRTRFDGVDIAATMRATDAWRTSDARIAASAHGRADSISTWMVAAETGLSDDDTGTGAALTTIFTAADRLAADPGGRAPRSAFLAAVDEAAGSIRTNAADLSRVGAGLSDAANSAVAALNSNLSALADLNLAIRRAGTGTAAHAELSDQRDTLIDAIAAQTDVTVDIAADGSATLTRGAQTLVNAGQSAIVAVTTAADGRISYDIGGVAFTPTSGALSGLQTSANTVADRRAALDTLAGDLATALNTWHANGRTPANAGGAALLDASGGAIALTALLNSPDQVAAADASGVANGNLLSLSTVRTASGVEGQWAALVNAQAQSTASARAAADRTSARKDTADLARDQVEGVDLDREAADLLRFQQAYEASARVIQMAKETVDTILRLF
jgi:flagellar hook-associated protein 1